MQIEQKNQMKAAENIICPLLVAFILLFISGCLGVPKGVQPVKGFKVNNYLGKWYEIARLDHSFERGLEQVTAEYSLRQDGGIKVINKGFSTAENKWKKVEGKAYFVEDNNIGYLKVSFWGPFYGSYVIFELDKKNYRYALVTSHNKSYLWFLSRKPTVDRGLLDSFIKKAKKLDYDTNELIFVKQ